MAHFPRAMAALLLLGILGTGAPGSAFAQEQPGGLAPNAASRSILSDGAAAVTGFSGAQLPTIIAPGVNPSDRMSLDLNGPSVRVIDLRSVGGPPQGQLIEAAKPFTATASQVGQVFAVALDNAMPANIYVAATSVYGLPIVGAGANRLQQGAPNAQFMAGLFGPQAQQGGPGSIWRIDGASGAISLFANVALDGAPNSGPALGGLAFDPASRSLFVADRETGMIHRFDMSGAERGRYDHGTQGRQAANLPPMAFDPSSRRSITNAQFRPASPETWGYAPPARRIFGLAVHDGRLFYAVAENLQIWSVALTPDGFGADARLEITVQPGPGASEIAKIAFDDQGRMLLAERAAPTGAADFVALIGQGGRVLRYAMAPSGPSSAPPAWTADEYAVGFAGEMRNGNGGVAVGYGYEPNGIDRNACGGFVWMSGEQLRVAADSTLASQLDRGGPPNVNGLQGNAIDAVRPTNAPPMQSYFVDFDDRFENADARGQIGDVAILRQCAGGPPAGPGPGGPGGPGGPEAPPPPPPPEQPFGPGPDQLVELWPDWPPPPPPLCPPGTHPENKGLQCCPNGEIPGVNGACQSPCSDGSTDALNVAGCYRGFQPGAGPHDGTPGHSAGTCWNGLPAEHLTTGMLCGNPAFQWTLMCNKCPKAPLKQCPSGQHFVAGTAPDATWEWSNGHCVDNVPGPPCPNPAMQKNQDGVCQDLCPAGQTAFPVNRCCANGTHVNALGQCPGVIAPPLWYLDFLATGSGPCQLPSGNCSFFEFTITGKQRFGRGSLTQRISLPAGSDFPTARITRGAKFCPPSAWTCSRSGNGFVCSAEDCGLAPGDQVVLHLEGRVAADLREPPATTIERTACGTLEWQALAGPGPVTTLQSTAAGAAAGQQLQPSTDLTRLLGPPSRQACWTIQILGRTPPQLGCAPNYVPTRDGQCCLASQMTKRGVCCPAGQRPDASGEQCVGQFVPLIPVQPICDPSRRLANGVCCPAGTTPNNRQLTCDPVTPPPETCVRSQRLVTGECCTAGTQPDAARKTCVSVTPSCDAGQRLKNGVCCPLGTVPNNTRLSCERIMIEPCPIGHHRVGRICVPDVVIIRPCPPGKHRVGQICVPDVIVCPPGKRRVGQICVPDLIACPPGKHRVGRTCVPNIVICPAGQHRVGGACVPTLQLRHKPPQLHPRATQPHFQLKQPLRRTTPGPY